MRIVLEAVGAVFLLVACAVGVQACLLLQSLRASSDAATKATSGFDLLRVTMQSQLTGKYGLIAEATAAARESRKTIDVLQKTSLVERAKVAAFSDASILAVNDLDTVARNAATTVRSLQDAVAGLGGLSAAMEDDARAVRPGIDAAALLLSNLDARSGKVLDRVTATVGDVGERVRAVEQTQRNIESATGHVDGASAALERGLVYVADAFKPAKKSFWVHVLDQVTGGVFSLWLKWIPQRVREVH